MDDRTMVALVKGLLCLLLIVTVGGVFWEHVSTPTTTYYPTMAEKMGVSGSRAELEWMERGGQLCRCGRYTVRYHKDGSLKDLRCLEERE